MVPSDEVAQYQLMSQLPFRHFGMAAWPLHSIGVTLMGVRQFLLIPASFFAVLLLLLIIRQNPADAESTGQPERNLNGAPQQLLQQFVDECITITPGDEAFPAEFQFGPVHSGEATNLPNRSVLMREAFRICRYETTQELYDHVMGQNPSRWKGPRNSVEYVSFEDASRFCERLTQLLRQADLISKDVHVRLPTEVEWEYCCRAGTTSLYSFATSGNDPNQPHPEADKYAWHTGNAAGNDPPVGALSANPWGLYDMHGYLWEFTSGSFARASDDSRSGAMKVIRGGSWRDQVSLLTSAARLGIPTHAVSDAIGFRCVIDSTED